MDAAAGSSEEQTELLDYSSPKGAITALTRSLSQNLAGKGIRVNAAAPGPIWTQGRQRLTGARKIMNAGSFRSQRELS